MLTRPASDWTSHRSNPDTSKLIFSALKRESQWIDLRENLNRKPSIFPLNKGFSWKTIPETNPLREDMGMGQNLLTYEILYDINIWIGD